MHEAVVADRAGIPAGGNGGGIFAGQWRGGDRGPSQTPSRAYVTGMLIGLSAIAMFFAAMVSAEVVRRGAPSGDWQPLRAGAALWRILSANTIVLLGSSFTLAYARWRARTGDAAGFRRWWIVTCALGALFLAGQMLAWRQLVHAGLYLATNPSSSFFYLITAAHGVHLAGGIIALLLVALRRRSRIGKDTAVEVASMYWHAMDAIWIVLFAFLTVGGWA